MIKSLTNFQTFNEKMILSTSRDDKKLILWDENTNSISYSYEDPNMKSYIPSDKIDVICKDLYSEYIMALQENKSLISVWNTNSSECLFKCTPIEDRITTFDISMNSKLGIFGTETGILYIYELFSGNILASSKVSGTSILGLKTFLRDAGMVTLLCQDYIKLFSIEELINAAHEYKDSESICAKPMIEIPNYDSFSKFVYIEELNLMSFYNTKANKIVIMSFPLLKTLKNIYIKDSNLSNNLISVIPNNQNLYLTFSSGYIFLLNLKEVLESYESDSPTITYNVQENLFPIIQSEIKITVTSISTKHILTGLEDGRIIVWNKFTLKQVSVFSQHKGAITNILVINRPISQYGLNFNNKIEESIVKPLKKPSIPYNHSITIKFGNNENFIEDLLEESYKEAEDFEAFDFSKHNKSNMLLREHFGIGNKTTNNIKSDKDYSSNIRDTNFLQKKLKELYTMLNNEI